MALEDFTTYTIEGTSGRISNRTATSFDADMGEGNTTIMYKDFGSGFFGQDKEIQIEYEYEYTTQVSNGRTHHGAISSIPGTKTQIFNDGGAQVIYVQQYASSRQVKFRAVENGVDRESLNTYNMTNAQIVYVKLSRPANSYDWTLEFFSDPERTSLVRLFNYSQTIDLDGRYLQIAMCEGAGATAARVVYKIRDLEVVSPSAQPDAPPYDPLMLGRPF